MRCANCEHDIECHDKITWACLHMDCGCREFKEIDYSPDGYDEHVMKEELKDLRIKGGQE